MSRFGLCFLLGASLVGGIACGDDNRPTSPAGPGVLEVVLSTPNGDDGAILFDVTGMVDSVQATGYTTFSAMENGGVRVVVTGDVVAGMVARLYVPDVSSADQYAANLLEAAQRSSFALQDVSGYRLSVERER